MKILCEKKELVNAITIVSKAVPTRTTMTILECILIDAAAQKITLIANDTELGIQTSIQGTIEEKGMIAIDAGVFSGIVRKLPDETVSITASGERVTIVCGKAKFEIGGRDGREFTRLPELEKNNGINITEFTLRDIINKTIFSISDNDSNKLMTGELMELKQNVLKLVSLDGHRISIRKVELAGSYSDRRLVIPGKTLGEIAKILGGDMEKQVSVFFTDKHVLFEFDETVVVSRLIEGEYFRIDQMLSSDYETRITINRRELLDCIDRATLLIKEGDKKPIILSASEENLEIRISTAIGSMDENIEISMEGREIMIGFNPRFMIDALRAIDDEEIDIYFMNPKAPCFIRNAEESYNYVILPVNFTTV
ncbi:DNA polymerase III subunit beta [Lachnoclostridium sp. Marseille-P6806]|uniref:DNA polymerase III subunit beta n=1 Tax=Lachnoclostridium sp. Marseille-P6806 TaxID=2364793 RepID=UPI0010311746|nr:DNA polymerase III subunit beta [Lachnoclostridium sp. Marseille-P6806]